MPKIMNRMLKTDHRKLVEVGALPASGSYGQFWV
jgi:hypothetical protein